KQMTHRPPHFATSLAIAPAHRFQVARLPLERTDFSAGDQLDVRLRGDAIDEIARHARRQARAAHQQPDLTHLARQVYRGLTGGVARAHERDLLPGAELPLDRRGPVVNTRALEDGEILGFESPISGPTGDDHRTRAHALLAAEPDDEATVGR